MTDHCADEPLPHHPAGCQCGWCLPDPVRPDPGPPTQGELLHQVAASIERQTHALERMAAVLEWWQTHQLHGQRTPCAGCGRYSGHGAGCGEG